MKHGLRATEILERSGHASNEAVAERIKHWARNGLLSTLGKQAEFPGTGNHRRYELTAVIELSVLNALAEARVHLTGRKDIFAALALANQAFVEWRRDEGRQYFLILVNGKLSDTCYIDRDDIKSDTRFIVDLKRSPTADFWITVNLSAIFARLQLPELPAADAPASRAPRSRHAVGMTYKPSS